LCGVAGWSAVTLEKQAVVNLIFYPFFDHEVLVAFDAARANYDAWPTWCHYHS
jgi:hypothetical protein